MKVYDCFICSNVYVADNDEKEPYYCYSCRRSIKSNTVLFEHIMKEKENDLK